MWTYFLPSFYLHDFLKFTSMVYDFNKIIVATHSGVKMQMNVIYFKPEVSARLAARIINTFFTKYLKKERELRLLNIHDDNIHNIKKIHKF